MNLSLGDDMREGRLFRVEGLNFVAGLWVDRCYVAREGWCVCVVDYAPILKRMRGWPLRRVVAECNLRGWRIRSVKSPAAVVRCEGRGVELIECFDSVELACAWLVELLRGRCYEREGDIIWCDVVEIKCEEMDEVMRAEEIELSEPYPKQITRFWKKVGEK